MGGWTAASLSCSRCRSLPHCLSVSFPFSLSYSTAHFVMYFFLFPCLSLPFFSHTLLFSHTPREGSAHFKCNVLCDVFFISFVSEHVNTPPIQSEKKLKHGSEVASLTITVDTYPWLWRGGLPSCENASRDCWRPSRNISDSISEI